MAFADRSQARVKNQLNNAKLLFERQPNRQAPDSAKFLAPRSLQILELLSRSGDRKTVYTLRIEQTELARKLHITRQALSSHFKKLRQSGFVQVGRGFVNVTEDGLKAVGYRKDPVIVTVRISPQRRSEAVEKIKALPAIETFRVAGDADAVLIVEQDKLDRVLEMLAGIDGVIDTKSLVSMVWC